MNENAFKNLKGKIKQDKKLLLIIILAVIAVLFLLIPELNFKASKSDESKTARQSESTYLEDTENKLKDIVSSIEGAGEAKVMVTLENSAEQVYAQNEKHKSDSDSSVQRPKSSISDEQEYVLIESNSRGEEGLIIKLIQPKIRGVAIVCRGGDSDKVKEDITEAVCAVLDISASRIYVAKMG